MTDRELLELAAKAAGIDLANYDNYGGGFLVRHGPERGALHVWNPLTDDGDRYRLAQDCRLIVDFDGGDVRWGFDGETHKRAIQFNPEIPSEAAYAIVRAAAEIGATL